MESTKCQEKGRSIMSDYTVYIDEAGDLGIGRGTRWFVLSAVIVAKEDESAIREKMRQIKNRLNVREIHLRKISEFPKRAFIVRELNSQNYTYINILVDTTKFDKAKIPDPLKAYNYVCKYLLERVSLFLEERGKVADIMLSARGTSRDGDLIKYIKEKLLPYEKNSINSAVFNKITARGAGEWELLQLADVCATTMFLTYEVNGFGFSTPCFSTAMSNHLYRYRGSLENYGIKFFTNDMKPNLEQLKATRVCSK